MTRTPTAPQQHDPGDSQRLANALQVMRTWPRNLDAAAQLRSLYDAAQPWERPYVAQLVEGLYASATTDAHYRQLGRWWGAS